MRTPVLRLLTLCFSVVLGAIVGLPPSAHATTMIFADVERLTEWSDVVVVGHIADATVYRGEMSRVTTDWTVVVDEVWKGDVDDSLVFSQWGGTLDGVTEHVPGDPAFTTGERVVLFLHRGDDGVLALTAMSQAVFRLEPRVSIVAPAPDRLTPVAPTLARPTASLALEDVVVTAPILAEPVAADWYATRHFTDLGFYNDADGLVVDIEDAESMSLSTLQTRVATVVAVEDE